MKLKLVLLINKKKKSLKKNFDDHIFQKSQFSICALYGIKFLMDFSWIRCISETLRKISFIASGSVKITYIVLIHMCHGRTGLLPLFEVKKWVSSHEPLVAWRSKKERKKFKEKISRLTLYDHGYNDSSSNYARD